THFDFDDTLCSFTVGHDLQCQRVTNFLECFGKGAMRGSPGLNGRRAGLAVGKDEERVVGGSIPVNADAVESSPCNIAQGFLKERGRNGGVRDDKRESGGEIWMDHPRTLGAA